MAITHLTEDSLARPCVLFDFDGTLADTFDGIVSTARRALLGHGIPEDELGDITRVVGPPFPHIFMELYGLSREDALDVTERYRAIYRTLGAESWPAFEGVPAMLEELHAAGRALGVVSSKRQEVLDHCAESNGLLPCFDALIGRAADGTETKADNILIAMERLGFGRDECLFVGDRDVDVEAALEAGIPCVGVTYGGAGGFDELAGAGAAAIVDSVDELKVVLLGQE